jgi:hypothetical protein
MSRGSESISARKRRTPRGVGSLGLPRFTSRTPTRERCAGGVGELEYFGMLKCRNALAAMMAGTLAKSRHQLYERDVSRRGMTGL